MTAVLLTAMPVSAIVTNRTSGGAAHATVQAAVDAAVSGDVLLVSTGTYVERVTIAQKSLDILGGFGHDFGSRVSNAPATCNHLSSRDGIMWSIGAKDIVEFNGKRWKTVASFK